MRSSTDRPAEPLRDAAREDLRRPLEALRAALEGLAANLDADVERQRLFTRALAELDQVGRCAEAMADYAVPPELHPMQCTVREVARAAHEGLRPDLRSRVMLAREPQPGRVFVDGPLLARRLSRLLEEVAVNTTAEILFHAHQDGAVSYFSIVETEPRDGVPVRLRLESIVARRDLERMGARVTTRRAQPDHRCLIVRLEPGAEGETA